LLLGTPITNVELGNVLSSSVPSTLGASDWTDCSHGLERPVAFQSTGCALSSRFLRDGAEKYLRANHSVLGIITIDCEHAHIVIG